MEARPNPRQVSVGAGPDMACLPEPAGPIWALARFQALSICVGSSIGFRGWLGKGSQCNTTRLGLLPRRMKFADRQLAAYFGAKVSNRG